MKNKAQLSIGGSCQPHKLLRLMRVVCFLLILRSPHFLWRLYLKFWKLDVRGILVSLCDSGCSCTLTWIQADIWLHLVHLSTLILYSLLSIVDLLYSPFVLSLPLSWRFWHWPHLPHFPFFWARALPFPLSGTRPRINAILLRHFFRLPIFNSHPPPPPLGFAPGTDFQNVPAAPLVLIVALFLYL